MFCGDPDAGYVRYVCPNCPFGHRVPRPRRCARPTTAPPAAQSVRTIGSMTLPALVLVAAYVAGRTREEPRPVETLRQADLVAETQETEV